jgi:hypothetical protein
VTLDALLLGKGVVFGIVRTISDLIMYKVAMNSKQITSEVEEEELGVTEMLEKISCEREQDFWNRK